MTHRGHRRRRERRRRRPREVPLERPDGARRIRRTTLALFIVLVYAAALLAVAKPWEPWTS